MVKKKKSKREGREKKRGEKREKTRREERENEERRERKRGEARQPLFMIISSSLHSFPPLLLLFLFLPVQFKGGMEEGTDQKLSLTAPTESKRMRRERREREREERKMRTDSRLT